MLRRLRYWFSRFWDRVPVTHVDWLDGAICRVAECFPAGWYDQNDPPPIPTADGPTPVVTILDELRAAVGSDRYTAAFSELVEMHRDARLMLAVYQCVSFDRLQCEFCGYDPAVLRVFYTHFHGLR